MTTILVPVDGSASSLNAVGLAIEIVAARKPATTLFILNVQPPIVSGHVKQFVSAQIVHAYYQDEGEKALRDAMELAGKAGVPARKEIEVGPIAETIAKFVKDHDCDLVIMGTRGLGSVGSLLLGSITTKVLHLVNVPVTLVK